MTMTTVIRPLQRDEVELLWQIERREIVQEIYEVTDGKLNLRRQFYDTRQWPDGETEIYTPILLDCFDHDGVFLGAFAGENLVAASVVDSRPVGDYPDLRQLAFLHVSHDWRARNLLCVFINCAKMQLCVREQKGFIFLPRQRGEL
jgi:predicted N-acetyltransferase YhbS